jgi:glucose dehydrogenase
MTKRPFPIFGCLLLVIIAAIAGALAVGGEFWSWTVLGAIAVVAGIALVIYLARRNRTTP